MTLRVSCSCSAAELLARDRCHSGWRSKSDSDSEWQGRAAGQLASVPLTGVVAPHGGKLPLNQALPATRTQAWNSAPGPADSNCVHDKLSFVVANSSIQCTHRTAFASPGRLARAHSEVERALHLQLTQSRSLGCQWPAGGVPAAVSTLPGQRRSTIIIGWLAVTVTDTQITT